MAQLHRGQQTGSPTPVKLFGRIFRMLRPYRGRVAAGMLCVVAAAPLALLLPRLIGNALELVLGLARGEDAPPNALLEACLLILGLALIEITLRYTARRTIIQASRRVEERLKNDLVAHMGRLPVTWFDRARTGDLISRLTQDVELLRFMVGPTLLHGASALLIVPGGIYMMAALSWKVFAIALACFGVMTCTMLYVMPRLHRHSKAVQESIADISQRCAEDFSGIRVLMTFGRAPAETRAMLAMCDEYRGHYVGLARMRALLNLCIHSCREMVMLGVLVVGTLEVIAGNLSLGQLFQFLLLISVMVWPLIAISWLLGTLQRARAAAERIEEVFAAEPEPRTGERPTLRGRIEVRDLDFSYPGESRAALSGVSFALDPGQKLGLIGPIGSGKSTLLDLMLRLYEPPRGTIFIDGFDATELHPEVLRGAFGVAPQDPFLFSDTIHGNVAFASGEVSADTLTSAVHTSALEQDLGDFPAGLDSLIGERGITLSGGQKQRVSLARALASEREALVLDDTFSAVDHHTESRILERLGTARAGRTTLVASHRVSAVSDSDLILVLENGRVIERGTHAQLVEQGGYYARAHERQRQRAALDGEEGS